MPGGRGGSGSEGRQLLHRAVSHLTRLLSSLVPRPISSVFQGKSREWLKIYHRRYARNGFMVHVDNMLTRMVALCKDQGLMHHCLVIVMHSKLLKSFMVHVDNMLTRMVALCKDQDLMHHCLVLVMTPSKSHGQLHDVTIHWLSREIKLCPSLLILELDGSEGLLVRFVHYLCSQALHAHNEGGSQVHFIMFMISRVDRFNLMRVD